MVWLESDDLGMVKQGDVIKSIYRALTVFGVAHHVDRNGNWRNSQDALLIPAAHSCFQIMQNTNDISVELMPTPGTMIAVTTDGVEHVLLWSKDAVWLSATTGDPIAADSHWDAWRLLAGEVNRVGE